MSATAAASRGRCGFQAEGFHYVFHKLTRKKNEATQSFQEHRKALCFLLFFVFFLLLFVGCSFKNPKGSPHKPFSRRAQAVSNLSTLGSEMPESQTSFINLRTKAPCVSTTCSASAERKKSNTEESYSLLLLPPQPPQPPATISPPAPCSFFLNYEGDILKKSATGLMHKGQST